MRIVSLISSATEILYLLGLAEQVVGVSHECDFPAEVAGKPRLTRSLVDASQPSGAIDEQVRSAASSGGALYEIDVEALAALRPDLIVTQAQCDVCAMRYEDVASAVERMPSLRETQILALNPRSLGDVFEDIGRVAAATRNESIGRDVAARLTTRVAAITDVSRGIERRDRPRVACLEWIEPPMLAANWMPQMVAMAGGKPGWAMPGAHSTCATWDEICEFDPQVVVIMPCGFDLARTLVEAHSLLANERWPELAAVQEGRVYAVDGNAYFNRSGPRLVDSLEILAHLLHPSLFPPGPLNSWQTI